MIGDETSPYFCKVRFVNDFRTLFDDENTRNSITREKSSRQRKKMKKNIVGHFDKVVYKKNQHEFGMTNLR